VHQGNRIIEVCDKTDMCVDEGMLYLPDLTAAEPYDLIEPDELS
jgi:hypothetical protein